MKSNLRGMIYLLIGASIAGCALKAPAPLPLPPPRQVQQPPPPSLSAHAEGTWEYLGKNGPHRQLILAPGGGLTFRGGFEFYNPGRWEVDAEHQELRIILPQADYDKLQIFQINVGDGVKAFDPHRKQVTYHFDANTWTLNIAGWPYSKEEKVLVPQEAEPVLQ